MADSEHSILEIDKVNHWRFIVELLTMLAILGSIFGLIGHTWITNAVAEEAQKHDQTLTTVKDDVSDVKKEISVLRSELDNLQSALADYQRTQQDEQDRNEEDHRKINEGVTEIRQIIYDVLREGRQRDSRGG